MHEQNGHERCRDFRPDECEALSYTQTKNIGKQVKADKDSKQPRKVGPLDETIPERSEGTTVELCGDREAAERRRIIVGCQSCTHAIVQHSVALTLKITVVRRAQIQALS